MNFKYCIIIVIGVFFLSFPTFSQNQFENKQLGVKILKPRNWIVVTSTDSIAIDARFSSKDDQLQKIINSSPGFLLLYEFCKYQSADMNSPRVRVTVSNNPTTSDLEFEQMVNHRIELEQYSVASGVRFDGPDYVTVSNLHGLYYSKHFLWTKDDHIMSGRTKHYIIPKGKYIITINFTDSETSEDCSKEFLELMEQLELNLK